jgi:hypothetical protein
VREERKQEIKDGFNAEYTNAGGLQDPLSPVVFRILSQKDSVRGETLDP